MAVGMGINMNIGQINKVIDTEDKNINKKRDTLYASLLE